jgi:hypothetical protein|tara:strand:- start:2 stop:370 length:369 start_codon:yes stop_codon:yes gene_type:complete
MANTFRVITKDVAPASAGTPETLYTCPGSTTAIVLGLILTNMHTQVVTADVILSSDTTTSTNTGAAANNTDCFLLNDTPIPEGSTLEILSGNKLCLQTTDILKIDCSIADKVSVALTIMEIT